MEGSAAAVALEGHEVGVQVAEEALPHRRRGHGLVAGAVEVRAWIELADLDSVAHVNNARYAAFLEQDLYDALAHNGWSLDPTVALGLKFYGKYLENSAVQVSLLTKVISALHYLLANLVVVVLVFAPALVWSLGHLLRRLRARRSETPLQTALAIFALAMLASHLAMTAWFTAGAAAINDGEAMRLHGRYLSAALIWLPPLYIFALTQLSPRLRKLCSAVLAGAVLLR